MPAVPCHKGLLLAAAACGVTGVLAGAFGAHALKERLGEHLAAYETGVLYHLIHAVALLVVAMLAGDEPPMPRSRGVAVAALAGWFMLAGVVIFSGSLYVLAILDQPRLGMITPIGGVSLLIGWTLLALAAWRLR